MFGCRGFGVEGVEFLGSGCLVPVVGEAGELAGGVGGEGLEVLVCGLVFRRWGDLGEVGGHSGEVCLGLVGDGGGVGFGDAVWLA